MQTQAKMVKRKRRPGDSSEPNQQNKHLINEAIKRILLDIVIRGHGDRLIGRWSRDPDVQAFLERVPYMLDRVNQLHLVCMRPEQTQDRHRQHHHHHHRHHHDRQHESHNGLNSSLHEFVCLIGADQLDTNAWLVRTRDSLGLTPLHKTVLFHNRPVCEFILDRYPDELAAASSTQSARSQTSVRLIDAQDKYGRTALHYAAASAAVDQQKQQQQNAMNTFDFFRFLTLKGASTKVRDFRGKTPDYYIRHPLQLRARSIIHLANKLNANYQATVLSRTLRAMTFRNSNDLLLGSGDNYDESFFGDHDPLDSPLESVDGRSGGHKRLRAEPPSENRESMSVSCADLSSCVASRAGNKLERTATSRSLTNLAQEDLYAEQDDDAVEDGVELIDSTTREVGSSCTNARSSSLCSSPVADGDKLQDLANEPALKRLLKDRSARLIMDDKKRLLIRRQLNEGKIDQINQLLVEGYGGQLLDEAPVACWNQQCRHYVLKIVPNLLRQLDTLHELIATNQFAATSKMLEQSHPILARIRRPYKRAAMNALHLAVQLNRKSMVSFLLERYPELVGQLDSNGATCLHWAARSLHNDRLYCWLSEHYGAQLESLRDDRGKTAADYRQQAIRLASFDDHEQPVSVRNPSTLLPQQQQRNDRAHFSAIMDEQRSSESQLEVNGAREHLANRPRRQRRQPAASPRRASPRRAVDRPEAEVQVRIGVESPSTLESSNEADSLVELRDSEPKGGTAEAAPSDDELPAMRDHDQTNRDTSAQADKNVTAILDGSLGDSSVRLKQAHEDEERCRLLSDELVRVDADEMRLEKPNAAASRRKQERAPKDNGAECSTPATATTTTAATTTTTTTKAETVEGGYRERNTIPIEEMIRQRIITNDLKKLEHLILAGCGTRIETVYKGLLASGQTVASASALTSNATVAGPAALVSAETRDFIERRAPGLMQTIERIHETLHKCYSHVTASSPTPASGGASDTAAAPTAGALTTTINLAQANNQRDEVTGAKNGNRSESKHVIEFMNSNFHKLCSQLASNSFIMARDKFGACPIHAALVRSDKRLLDYLLRRDPNAASAPDHENRNALHYAAIVLTAFERHGPIKLIVGFRQGESDPGNGNDESAPNSGGESGPLSMGAAQAHWLVDSTAKLLYDDLCARYGDELAGVRDKHGKTHLDYRRASEERPATEGGHIRFDGLPQGLYQADLIGNCCREYSRMLKRYNYLIWVDQTVSGVSQVSSVRQLHGPRGDTRSLREPHRSSRDSNNSSNTDPYCEARPEDGEPGANSQQVRDRPPGASTSASRTSGEPAPHPPSIELSPSTSAMGDQQLVGVAEILDGALTGTSVASDSVGHADLAGLEPRGSVSRPLTQKGRKAHHRRSPRGRRGSSARHSIVGGVIVPTIIHNDKMDEIETYDIIYRQPPSSRCSSSSSSSASSLSSSSVSLSHELDGSNSPVQPVIDDQHLSKQLTKTLTRSSPSHSGGGHHHHHHHHHRGPGDRFALPNGVNLLPEGSQPALADSFHRSAPESGSSSSASSDEGDERVERLSNEFETRVRREKNELRAKVDQIMKEIKMSAKSSKSSRFLSSPNDLTALSLINSTNQKESKLMGNHQTGGKHRSSIASASSKTTTTSESSCSSPSNACSNSQCSSATSSLGMDQIRQARTSSCSSASTSASSSSAASSPTAAKLLASSDQATRASKKASALGGSQNPSAAQSKVNQEQPRQHQQQQQQQQSDHPQQHLSGLTEQLVSKNTYGQTYLHFIASRSQSSSTLYKVLDHGNHLIAERDVFYRTARDVALQFNLLNNVQLFDKFIIDLFVQGSMQLLWVLLKQGYSPLIHVADPDGNDIMLILKLLKRDNMICYLLQMADFQRWRDELHTFIRNNYISGAVELIKKHKDLVRAKSVYARTSLHLAVLFDRIEVVTELIKMDPASVHVVDNMGRTPLHYAFGLHLKNGDSIRESLITAGAQLDFRDVRQRTPKYYYIFRREIEEIRRIELGLN